LLLPDTKLNTIKKLFPSPREPESSAVAGMPDQNDFFSEDTLMNKLIATLVAGAFALGSVAALADDKTPAQPVDQAKLKAEREAAKAEKAKQTPEQKKAKRAEHSKELSTAEKGQQEGGATAKMKAEDAAKDAAAAKGQPKALPTKAEKQKALKEQEKKSSGQ
jgi:hypothetical protein